MTTPSSELKETPPPRKVKVAVIGSGLAGLSAAYLLSTLRTRTDISFEEGEDVNFEVHIFEKAADLGMDSYSASLALPSAPDAEWRVDVPMRAFQGGYYPHLIRLYTHLGVAFRKADFSYSFTTWPTVPDEEQTRTKGPVIRPHFLYEGASGKKGIGIPAWKREEIAKLPSLAQRSFARMRMNVIHALWCIVMLGLWLRFIILCTPFFRPKNIAEMTWEEWVAKYSPSGPLARWTGLAGAWRSFIEEICLPMYSGICSATRKDVSQHPAEEFLDFNLKTVGTHHYLVSNGVRDVVSRLSANMSASQIHLNAPTTAILPDKADPALVSVVCTPASGEPVSHSGFAHVIFATQAKYAAPLVREYSMHLSGETKARATELAACLARVKYRETIVVNHTDARFLPSNPRDRRDLNVVTVTSPPSSPANFRLDPSIAIVPPSYSMATQRLTRPAHVPRLVGPDGEEEGIYQTTNPIVAPDSARILSVGLLERALLTIDGKNAAKMLYRPDGKGAGQLQGAARRAGGAGTAGLWVVGAYAYYGIPMLEGCVVSARDVVAGPEGIVACAGGKVTGELW